MEEFYGRQARPSRRRQPRHCVVPVHPGTQRTTKGPFYGLNSGFRRNDEGGEFDAMTKVEISPQ